MLGKPCGQNLIHHYTVLNTNLIQYLFMSVTFLVSVMVNSSLDLTKFVRKQLTYDYL